MKILIGADIVPTKPNINLFSIGDIEQIIDKSLKSKLQQADFRIFNLEVPFTDKEAPIKKSGPNLIAPTSCIKGVKELGVNLFTLANNHIMDHDVSGLNSTIKVLNENQIDYVGAGENLSEATKPYIIDKDGLKIGIYACAEHEFSIATENFPGANPFDPLETPDHITDLKKQCDYVIVLYHGGKEHYRYPSPNLQKICRKLCDKGADMVVCQHSHCIGCREEYNGSIIVYGQGNFIFDKHDNEFWNSALLLEVDFSDTMSVNYIPLERVGRKVQKSDNISILNNFEERSEQIKSPEFIEKKYTEFAIPMLQGYLHTFCGVSKAYRVINKLCGKRLKKKIKEKRKLAMSNFIECEAHRELLLTGLKTPEK